MKILVVTQYFWPETFVINDLVKTLGELGHEVSVLTGKPNYPGGAIFAGYRAAGVVTERFSDAVTVYRTPIIPRGNGGGFMLLINYLSFALFSCLVFPWFVRKSRIDSIFVFAPSPVTVVLPGIILKWLTGGHLALWVQDLWPQSLEATGFVRNKNILRSVGCVVKWLYSRCDTILISSKGFEEPISLLASKDKIIYYPNSLLETFDCSSANSGSKINGVCGKLPEEILNLLNDKFCIVFAGNIGTAQAVETWLQASKLLSGFDDIKILIVGTGSRLEWLREKIRLNGLTNLITTGPYSPSLMPDVFQRAQGLLVTLSNETIFSQTVPSKIQAYLAAGRPIIAAINGEAARIINESNAGLHCSAEDGDGLARIILSLYKMPEEDRLRMGRAGKKYFQEFFDMNVQARRLIEILKTRCKK